MSSSYRLEKVLGEGTWGLVYKAFRESDNTKVAIKRSKGIDNKFDIIIILNYLYLFVLQELYQILVKIFLFYER